MERTNTWEVMAKVGREQMEMLQQIQDELSATRDALEEERAARAAEIEDVRAAMDAAVRESATQFEHALDAERAARNALGRRVGELARELAEERSARAVESRRLADLECRLNGKEAKKNGEVMYQAIPPPPPPLNKRPHPQAYAPPPPPELAGGYPMHHHIPRPPDQVPLSPDGPHNGHTQQQWIPHRTHSVDDHHQHGGGTRSRSRSWQDGFHVEGGGQPHPRKVKQRSPRASPNHHDDHSPPKEPRAASPEMLRELEDQILVLCDDAPNGSILCANLPRLYYYRFRKTLDFRVLGFMKMSQLLSKMDRIHYDGKHRAEVSRKVVAPPPPPPPPSDPPPAPDDDDDDDDASQHQQRQQQSSVEDGEDGDEGDEGGGDDDDDPAEEVVERAPPTTTPDSSAAGEGVAVVTPPAEEEQQQPDKEDDFEHEEEEEEEEVGEEEEEAREVEDSEEPPATAPVERDEDDEPSPGGRGSEARLERHSQEEDDAGKKDADPAADPTDDKDDVQGESAEEARPQNGETTPAEREPADEPADQAAEHVQSDGDKKEDEDKPRSNGAKTPPSEEWPPKPTIARAPSWKAVVAGEAKAPPVVMPATVAKPRRVSTRPPPGRDSIAGRAGHQRRPAASIGTAD